MSAMPMRVISGSAKGRHLKLVPGEGTRPIMDRVKEALFNILGDNIRGATFLDLFAGTGSVGIEALSRGANRAVFVENAGLAINIIQENLKATKLTDRAQIVRADVFDYLKKASLEPFEYVYIAPPQYKGIWKKTLLALDTNPVHVQPDGIVIVQIDPQEEEAVSLQTLIQFDERRYGKTLLRFFERPGE
jgi:16S rRNA (guanine966-N2)-methyltransferase